MACGTGGGISRLDENPNDRDQQQGSEPDYGDLRWVARSVVSIDQFMASTPN